MNHFLWFANNRGKLNTYRIVMSWLVKGSYVNSSGVPNKNFDLYLYSPSEQLIDSSNSTNNAYEIIEFTASQSGIYKIKIRRESNPGGSNLGLGLAIVKVP